MFKTKKRVAALEAEVSELKRVLVSPEIGPLCWEGDHASCMVPPCRCECHGVKPLKLHPSIQALGQEMRELTPDEIRKRIHWELNPVVRAYLEEIIDELENSEKSGSFVIARDVVEGWGQKRHDEAIKRLRPNERQ